MITERHQALLEARGFDLELIEKLGVESCERRSGDMIAIPYLLDGKRVNDKFRTISGPKRFHQREGKKPIFWNVDVLRDQTLADQPVIITEGEFDAISAIQAGFVRTLSVPNGAPAEETKDDSGTRYDFLQSGLPLLADCKEIILATDNDEPGINLLNDLAVRLGKARCKWVKYPVGCKDLNDALAKFGARGVVETINRAQWVHVDGVYRMSALPPLPAPLAYSTGIANMDKHWKMRLGDFTAVVGIPGHGKTTFLNEIAGRMANDYGWITAFASFEQPPQRDHRRNLRTFFNRKMERHQTVDELAAADEWIEQHFVFIKPGEEDEPTIEWVIEKCQAAAVQHGAKLIIIDPWNELEHKRPQGVTETEYVGFSLAQLRRMARRLNIHLIVATHPTKMERAKDGKLPVPTLYDASGSANWANKPDVGIVIHRDSEDTTINVQKVRYHDEIGKPGTLKAMFLPDMARFEIILEEDKGIFAA